MPEPVKPWTLPGPAAFVARMCAVAERQKVVVLHAPFSANSVAAALHDQINRDGRYSPRSLVLGPDAPFEVLLATEASVGLPSRRSPASLATSPELENAAVVVSIRGPADAGLATFTRLLRRKPEGEGPILLVVSSDGACEIEGHAPSPVRSVFGPLDGAAYAAALPRSRDPLEGRLVAAVAIEVAAWDVALLDRLTALPPDQAVRPDQHVGAWDDGQTAQWKGVPRGWDRGSVDDWGGEPAEHPLWLAANQPAALTKRVWRGQLAMLLPWIEQYRQLIIAREGNTLRADSLNSGSDIEYLDFGPLCVQLKRVPELKPLLPFLRTARNELAHGRPISWNHIRECLKYARAYAGEGG